MIGHAKEGEKPGESAECKAQFTVKAFESPTLTCTASPRTVAADGIAVIMAYGTSPQNRPLKYTYSASAGLIEGNDFRREAISGRCTDGPNYCTCHVTDDKGTRRPPSNGNG